MSIFPIRVPNSNLYAMSLILHFELRVILALSTRITV
jgi:hypothetical protein